MGNKTFNEYNPDLVSPPGSTLNDIIKSMDMSQAELAQRTGRPKKTINEIIKGKSAITPDTALQLEKVLKMPASFWINREKNYREHLARKKELKKLNSRVQWIRNFPVNEMAKYRWIKKSNNKIKQLIELLTFYSVASPTHWNTIWNTSEALYRKTDNKQINVYLISAWLRKGQIIAQNIESLNYNKRVFLESLIEARKLTKLDPEEFVPILTELCSKAGVALAFVPELKSLGVWGATRWLNPNKALIQLSLRYKTNDHLWFTFFHEAAHIIKHGKSKKFIETSSIQSIYEDEANEFSRNFLISKHEYNNFLKKSNLQENSIINFAENIGIHPGIVVGRLQHDGYLNYKTFYYLKATYEWKISNE